MTIAKGHATGDDLKNFIGFHKKKKKARRRRRKRSRRTRRRKRREGKEEEKEEEEEEEEGERGGGGEEGSLTRRLISFCDRNLKRKNQFVHDPSDLLLGLEKKIIVANLVTQNI